MKAITKPDLKLQCPNCKEDHHWFSLSDMISTRHESDDTVIYTGSCRQCVASVTYRATPSGDYEVFYVLPPPEGKAGLLLLIRLDTLLDSDSEPFYYVIMQHNYSLSEDLSEIIDKLRLSLLQDQSVFVSRCLGVSAILEGRSELKRGFFELVDAAWVPESFDGVWSNIFPALKDHL